MMQMAIPVFSIMLVALFTLLTVPVLYAFVAELQLKLSTAITHVSKTEK